MKLSRSLLAWLMISAWFVSSVSAAEPARQFLNALRERHYFDIALDYLNQVATSPSAPAELKESLLYEKGATLIEASRFQQDSALRENELNEAQQLLQQFVTQQSDHPRASAARNQLGTVAMERARIAVVASKKGNTEALKGEAKRRYEEAHELFVKARQDLTVQLDRIPKFLNEKDPESQRLAERRTQLRSDNLDALMSMAVIREEMADTVDPSSPEFRNLLTDAAKQYGEIYESYRTRLPGQYARMYQGRCNQKLKKFPEAVGFLTEILDTLVDSADADPVRELITKSLRSAMECWLEPSQRKFVDAIKRAEDWISKARTKEERQPDWLQVRLLLARAYVMRAEAAKASNPRDKTIEQSLTSARRHAGFVARFHSDFQVEAQALIAQLGGPGQTGIPTDFAQASDFSKAAVEVVQARTRLVKELSAERDRERDSDRKLDLQKRLDEANQTLTTSVNEALRLCHTALSLVDHETQLGDIIYIRYLLCFLHYSQQHYYEAALLGEFVSKRYPDSVGARQCAKIAMVSYVQLYAENKSADKSFEAERIVSIAEFIATTWPDQPEAAEAFSTLIPFMINAGELPRALELVAKIPESSGKRGEAELKTGQSLWAAYVKGLNEILQWEKEGTPAGLDLASRKAALESTKSKAMELLTTGYDRIQQKAVADTTTGLAMLALAQVYVESQQPLKSIEVLEHPALGPLKLIADKHPVAAEQTFVEETYKIALRAYISALPVAADRAAMQSKAQETMNKLKGAVEQQQGGQQRLVAVFVSLAHSIEEQLKVAPPDANKKILSEAFESFLQQIRMESTDFSVLNWIAETFNSLGGGYDNTRELSPEATHYFQESIATFTKVLSETQLEPQLRIQIQARLAIVLRRKREFEKAIETYKEVLTTSNMLVNIQAEAARSYQEWGAESSDPVPYQRAISGAFPNAAGKNTLWGWGRLSQVTAGYPQFRDTFHEACVHLAQCRVRLAEKKQGEDKEKLLKSAFNGIVVVYRLHPDLGGEKWMPQYNDVLIEVQKAQGAVPDGIKALPPPAKAPAASGSAGTNATTPISTAPNALGAGLRPRPWSDRRSPEPGTDSAWWRSVFTLMQGDLRSAGVARSETGHSAAQVRTRQLPSARRPTSDRDKIPYFWRYT